VLFDLDLAGESLFGASVVLDDICSITVAFDVLGRGGRCENRFKAL
jgi:hypothetical protein